MNRRYIRLHETDNVVVATQTLEPGAVVVGHTLAAEIPVGHKIATCHIPSGERVIKYSQPVGVAKCDIPAGSHVHTHNLEAGGHEVVASDVPLARPWPVTERRTFKGYLRPDGRRAGTRNYVGIVTSVNCSATVARRIADHFRDGVQARYPNVDGVVVLTHGSGCAMDGAGEGLTILRRTLRGYVYHPNFAGVLVVGLGCETNQIEGFLEDETGEGATTRTLGIQAAGGTLEAIRNGIDMVEELLEVANGCARSDIPASELCLGLQCGGSDGFSGISANPALGAAADLLVAEGGTVLLSETPEIYGAEHLLLDRAVSHGVRDRLMARIRWWEDYVARNGGRMDNNPSHGNKQGGLTTILEKSLGAVAKGGTSPLMEVSEYAAPVAARGLVFMDSPGFDPVSVTGQVAAGANIVCFTTGRGSVFGCKPCPSLKLATNTRVFDLMADDMDVNCGQVIDGGKMVAESGADIFEAILATASGAPTKSELLNYGDNEFTPWIIGAVM